jgi:hypothetical protein
MFLKNWDCLCARYSNMDPWKANLSVGPNLVKPIAKGFTKIFQIYLFPMHRKKEGEHFF